MNHKLRLIGVLLVSCASLNAAHFAEAPSSTHHPSPAVAKATEGEPITSAQSAAPSSPTTTTRHDYPQWRNDGSGSATDSGAVLLEDFSKAKVVWKSEEVFPDTYSYGGPNFHKYPDGGFTSPTVADGRVFVQYYRPSGDFIDMDLRTRWPAWPEECFKVGADDVLVCLDAATGKTIWKQVFVGKGCYLLGCRGLMHTQPAVQGDRVYFVGSLGVVYCLNIADGALVWESNTGAGHDWAVKRLEEWKSKEYKFDPANPPSKPGGPQFMTVFSETRWRKGNEFDVPMPQLAVGLLICNDGRKGVVALELADGKQRWYRANAIEQQQSPTVAKLADGTYCVFTTYDREGMQCTEAATGRLLWSVKDIGWSPHFGPTVSGSIMVAAGPKPGMLSGYRVDAQGATKLWTADPERVKLGGNAAKWVNPVIYRGHVYATVMAADNRNYAVSCIDLETGAVKGVVPQGPGDKTSSWVASDGRLINGWTILDADPSNFRLLLDGAAKKVAGLPTGTAYVTCVLVDGRYYYRDGSHVWCIDFRK